MKPKRGRPTRHEALEKAGQRAFFDKLLSDDDALENTRALLKIGRMGESWRGLMATPPGSLLDKVITAFKTETNIPLEIPFFATMHHLSTHLLWNNVKIQFAGNELNPDLWTIVLAQSGSSKTFSVRTIEKAVGETHAFPSPGSSANFIKQLAEGYNRHGWVQDEMGKFLKSMETLTQYAELKRYLLELHDGHRMERNLAKSSIVIDDPALSILGMSVLETFTRELPEGSLVDGFAQRFSYVIANKDETRPMRDFPSYNLSNHLTPIQNEWQRVVNSIKHDTYHVGKAGERAYNNMFVNLIPENEDMNESFYRRVMWRGVRYALMYHVLLKKKSKTIDEEDMAWAGRIVMMHLQDASKLLTEHNLPELGRMVMAAEAVRDRVQRTEGRQVTARDITRGVHGIRYASEANAILRLIN